MTHHTPTLSVSRRSARRSGSILVFLDNFHKVYSGPKFGKRRKTIFIFLSINRICHLSFNYEVRFGSVAQIKLIRGAFGCVFAPIKFINF